MNAHSESHFVHVGNSVTGETHVINLQLNSVEELRNQLYNLSSIPNNDQILLCGPPFLRLDHRKSLEHYRISADSKKFFLYDRRLLYHDKEELTTPVFKLELEAEIEDPPTPVTSSEGSRLLAESASPLMRALVDYEAQFQMHLTQSQTGEKTTSSKIRGCEKSLSCIRLQSEAMGAAISNLKNFEGSMSSHFNEFMSNYTTASEMHQELLDNFENYLTSLSNVKLHPELASDAKITLLDCIPIERENQWVVQCQRSHFHMKSQVDQLQSMYIMICNEIAETIRSQENIDEIFLHAKESLDKIKAAAEQQKSTSTKIRENYIVVVRKVTETSEQFSLEIGAGSTYMAGSTSALEACRSLDELWREQCELVPGMQAVEREIGKEIERILESRTLVFTSIHANLRQLSIQQSRIRDFENSLAMLKEALEAQKMHFAELEHLKILPDAYFACLREISRRIKYGRTFSNRIQSMAEDLAHMREKEVERREKFLREYGQHLPRDFVPCLAEKPSHCEFRMRPLDQGLPQIELKDTENVSGNVPQDDILSARMELSIESDDQKSSEGADVETATNKSCSFSLKKRCKELEDRVADLISELQQVKEGSYFSSDSCGSIPPSEASKASGREGDSSCELPLVLALAATAGAMTSSSEADRSNLLEQGGTRTQSNKRRLELELEKEIHSKNQRISELEGENHQFLLNAAAFEEELQERIRKEKQLLEKQSQLQASIISLRSCVEIQRSSLNKVIDLLGLPPSTDFNDIDPEKYLSSSAHLIESRVRELLFSTESEKSLRSELKRQREEITLLESERANFDPFKISFRRFHVNDLALFLPTASSGTVDSHRIYLAFHLDCPHHFLSDESISSFYMASKRYPDFVLGRIVLIDEQVASESNNPYFLRLGTVFYVLTVTSLNES